MHRILYIALVLAASASSSKAQTGTMRYVAALAVEKGEGDLDRAVALYQELLAQPSAGRLSAVLAARARDRLALLGIQTLEPRAIPLPFQTFAERLGVTSAERLSVGTQPVGDLQVAGIPLRPPYLSRGRSGHPSLAGSTKSGDLIYRLEQQIRALRYALGITGLLEYMEEMAQHRRGTRSPDPYEMYQQGLLAERQEGDLARAAELYEQVLATAFVSAPLRHQLNRRLTDCRTRLEEDGGQR